MIRGYPLPMSRKVKKRPRASGRTRVNGQTRVSSKHQVTIPIDAFREAGLKPGDVVKVQAEGPGVVTLTTIDALIDRYAGSMPGVFEPGFLERLRDEWER
jgi:bifunctional DNA-binding transcriptional regulator/antitoxin component of YhaV-PrlF toxin-antitoxin module